MYMYSDRKGALKPDITKYYKYTPCYLEHLGVNKTSSSTHHTYIISYDALTTTLATKITFRSLIKTFQVEKFGIDINFNFITKEPNILKEHPNYMQ